MMVKVLKSILFATIGLIGTIFISYYLFLGVEYATGGPFVEYLTVNQETVKIGENFSFETLDKDIPSHDLILVGEIHGFKEPQSFDFNLIQHLHKKHGVRHYLAELDIVQARIMNEYMKANNDSLLYEALNNWAVIQGVNNKDYYDKYRAFKKFNNSQTEENKFEFVSLDKIQDWRLLTSQLNGLIKKYSSLQPIQYDLKTIISQAKSRIEKMLLLDSVYEAEVFFLKSLLVNIEYVELKKNRD